MSTLVLATGLKYLGALQYSVLEIMSTVVSLHLQSYKEETES